MFFRLYNLLENTCHELDLAYAQATGSLDIQGGASFDKYSSALHRLSLLKDEAEQQKQTVSVLEQFSTYMALTVPEESPSLDKIRHEARVQRQRLQDIVKH